MMQIVPVGSRARRAARWAHTRARLFGPLQRAVSASVVALGNALGLLRRLHGG